MYPSTVFSPLPVVAARRARGAGAGGDV